MMNFSEFSPIVNWGLFAAAAVVVWLAGTKLTVYTDAIAERYAVSRALLGLLLLAVVTSLPEIATSLSAAATGSAKLAVNNLLGSIAMQVALLAIADGLLSKRALTSVVPDPVVILQGAINIYLLSLVATAAIVGDVAFLGAGAWTWSLLVLTLYCFKKLAEGTRRKPWQLSKEDEARLPEFPSDTDITSNTKALTLFSKIGVAALLILMAGFVVAQAGDAIAEQSGLGESFMGVALVAIATSLPEASTVFASVKRGLYSMAISDIFGTNILNVALIFAVDMVDQGEPVFNVVGNFAAAAAVLGIVVVSAFLIGLAERRDRTFFRLGEDSIIVIIAYGAGLTFLYFMRN